MEACVQLNKRRANSVEIFDVDLQTCIEWRHELHGIRGLRVAPTAPILYHRGLPSEGSHRLLLLLFIARKNIHETGEWHDKKMPRPLRKPFTSYTQCNARELKSYCLCYW